MPLLSRANKASIMTTSRGMTATARKCIEQNVVKSAAASGIIASSRLIIAAKS
jgi:hypothetical protein